ncbi:MAG TPA: dicarboxylate/amino acid:cation symporter [Chitinophagaceae bacterium]|nr:dicarboxylate/amino acid:cation symporter [Chitinophagaceae bacterium]
MKKNKLTSFIFIAMLLGIATGITIHETFDATIITKFSENISILTDVFLRLIKMIIAPLVLSTLVVGIAKLGDIKAVGRIGGRSLLWFIGASLISLLMGMLLVNIFEPGIHLNLPKPETATNIGIEGQQISLKNFIAHIFPKSIIEAMATNEILQIVIFSIFLGVATAAIGEKGTPLIKGLDALAHAILKVTAYVMNFAPLAAFAAMASILAIKGSGILKTFGLFIGEFYIGLLLLWIVLAFIGFLFIQKKIFSLLRHIKEPVLLAFSTASSEAAFPKLMQQLERFGCPPRVTSFVLPLGYSFNLDGSMMYMTFASIFIAQAYGVPLDFGQQITMLLILMLTSKGIAGVPRASLVVIAGTLATFHIPVEGIGIILGVDQLLDMGRSATNVLGNSLATAVVSKWEK